jgi:hypothetical protein
MYDDMNPPEQLVPVEGERLASSVVIRLSNQNGSGNGEYVAGYSIAECRNQGDIHESVYY